MTDVETKARFRIMMLIAELQELAEASPDPRECERIETLLLKTIDELGKKPKARAPKLMLVSAPGRA